MEGDIWMILFEEVAPGDFYTRIGMIIVGGLIFLQGVRIRCSNPPKFVANYRGWSSPELALPLAECSFYLKGRRFSASCASPFGAVFYAFLAFSRE